MPKTGDTPPTVEAVLFEREARGLRVPVWARIVLGSVGFVSMAYTSVEVVRLGESPAAVLILAFASALVVAANLYFLSLLGARRGVAWVGLAGALIDVADVAALGVVLFHFSVRSGQSPGIIFKSELPSMLAALIAVNGLALKARYPLIVGSAVTTLMATIAMSVALDPESVYSIDPAETFAGPALDAPQLVTTVLFLGGTTAAVAFMAWVARRTIRTAVESEVENARLQQEQLQLVMREKVAALGRLVAGVSHEINNPLAVAMSGTSTQRLALDKLQERIPKDDPSTRRALHAAHGALAATADALARIQQTERALRTFAHLDEADLQRVHLDEALAATVALLPTEDRPLVNLEPSDGTPELYGHAKELNQMLLTLLRAAVDRVRGSDGTVEARSLVEGAEVVVHVRDEGPARTDAERARLFDVALGAKGERVAADFDLPVAQAVAQRHGGSIVIESGSERGNRFVVRLPIGRPESDSGRPATRVESDEQ